MSEVYSFKGNNSLSRDKLNYTGGSFRNIHYGDIHTKFSLHFRVDAEPVPYINDGESHSAIRPENYCMAGDMVFADASEDMADIGKAIEIIDAGDIPLVSGLHTILAKPNGASFVLGFGAYLFSSESVRRQIQREAQGAKVLGLSSSRLGNVQLHYPSEADEQQKIADCLSSLDDLITAETQKLDTIKAHKKGLMQQLFPRNGETVPQLRFPEFRGAGGWEVKALDQLGELVSGLTYSPDDVRDEGLLVLRSSNVQDGRIVLDDNVYVRSDIKGASPSLPNDILICVRNGSKSLIGKNALIPEDMPPCTHGAFMTVFRSGAAKFIIQLFQTEAYERQVAADLGATINSINGNQLKKYKFRVPEAKEQQVIADCLSSFDDLITAQTQKIDALKTHKKGLMQQLFPTLDEVGA